MLLLLLLLLALSLALFSLRLRLRLRLSCSFAALRCCLERLTPRLQMSSALWLCRIRRSAMLRAKEGKGDCCLK